MLRQPFREFAHHFHDLHVISVSAPGHDDGQFFDARLTGDDMLPSISSSASPNTKWAADEVAPAMRSYSLNAKGNLDDR